MQSVRLASALCQVTLKRSPNRLLVLANTKELLPSPSLVGSHASHLARIDMLQTQVCCFVCCGVHAVMRHWQHGAHAVQARVAQSGRCPARLRRAVTDAPTARVGKAVSADQRARENGEEYEGLCSQSIRKL